MRPYVRTCSWMVFFLVLLLSCSVSCSAQASGHDGGFNVITFSCGSNTEPYSCTMYPSDAPNDAGAIGTTVVDAGLPQLYCPDQNGNGLPDCQLCVELVNPPPSWILFMGQCDPDDEASGDAGMVLTVADGGSPPTTLDAGSVPAMVDAGTTLTQPDAGLGCVETAGCNLSQPDAGPSPPTTCMLGPPNVDNCQVADPAPDNTLVVFWGTTNDQPMSSIMLSGEVNQGGIDFLWTDLVHAADSPSVIYALPGVASGDWVRFSVQFWNEVGNTSWSCIGPWPMYAVQGLLEANVGQTPVAIEAVGDPTGQTTGCGFIVHVP